MGDTELVLRVEHDEHLGKLCSLKVQPRFRGSSCSYDCPKCGKNNTTNIPKYGMTHRFINCDSCGSKLIILLFKLGYGSDSVDMVYVSGAVKKSWLESMQPEKDFVDVRNLPEYDRMVYQYGSSQPAYMQLNKNVALERNRSFLSMFKTNDGEEILTLW